MLTNILQVPRELWQPAAVPHWPVRRNAGNAVAMVSVVQQEWCPLSLLCGSRSSPAERGVGSGGFQRAGLLLF